MHQETIYLKAQNFDKNQALAIIPAAGFGSRVGSPPAKELLLHPNGQRFIDHTIDLAYKLNTQVLVISRKDKHALNEYLIEKQKHDKRLSLLLIDQTPEWTWSVQLASPYFHQKNILLLPDSDWGTFDVGKDLLKSLDSSEISVGVFQVENPKVWGMIEVKENSLFMGEKPLKTESHLAWGLISFQGSFGKIFWEKYKTTSQQHHMIPISTHFKILKLQWFRDLSR
jgi:dTDP-glucose pyrophosphorylase